VEKIEGMADHDIQLLKEALPPIRAYDANGNFNQQWYLARTICLDNHEREFRMYVYEDGSYQIAHLWSREPMLGSW
jgi:hypothetical protein